jgi:hypothetical protein
VFVGQLTGAPSCRRQASRCEGGRGDTSREGWVSKVRRLWVLRQVSGARRRGARGNARAVQTASAEPAGLPPWQSAFKSPTAYPSRVFRDQRKIVDPFGTTPDALCPVPWTMSARGPPCAIRFQRRPHPRSLDTVVHTISQPAKEDELCMKRRLRRRGNQAAHRRFSLSVGVIAVALVVGSAGLAIAHGTTETLTVETWLPSTGYMKGQTKYSIDVQHYEMCAYVALYLKNSRTNWKWGWSGFSNVNCNPNHPASGAQVTTNTPIGAVCDANGTNYWQARGYGYAKNVDHVVVHREPDTNLKWGNVVTVQC